MNAGEYEKNVKLRENKREKEERKQLSECSRE